MHRSWLLRIAPLVMLIAAPMHVQAQDSTVYQIDTKQSTITYAMEHPAHAWTGTSKKVSGLLTLDADGAVLDGRIKAPVMSFDSANRNRDSHMGEVVEFYIYPDVVFEADSVVYRNAPADSAVVHGTLTFHGVSRAMQVPVQIKQRPKTLSLHGAFDVTLTEFDLELPSLMMIKVKDWIGVTLDLVAHPGSS